MEEVDEAAELDKKLQKLQEEVNRESLLGTNSPGSSGQEGKALFGGLGLTEAFFSVWS